MLDDVKGMVKLITALVSTKHEGIGERTVRERVALRTKEYAGHLAAGNAVMAKMK
jgi:endoglucanase